MTSKKKKESGCKSKEKICQDISKYEEWLLTDELGRIIYNENIGTCGLKKDGKWLRLPFNILNLPFLVPKKLLEKITC